MGIKSLAELKQINERHREKIRLRHGYHLNEHEVERINILVGMGTCGIAAGAREILIEIMEEVSKNNFENIWVMPVDCMGTCEDEPVIQINIPGEEPVIYRNVKKEDVKEMIENHVTRVC